MGTVLTAVPGDLAHPKFLEIIVASQVTEGNTTTRPFLQVYNLYRVGTTTPTTIKQTLVQDFKNVVDAPISALLTDNYATPGYYGRWVDDPLDPSELEDTGAAGAVTTDSLPSRVGVTVKLTSGVRGRNYRGSKHYGPIPESATTKDNLTSGAKTAWDAIGTLLAATPLFTDADGNDWQLMILSQRLSNLTSRPAVITGALVNAASANSRIGSMQRRRERLAT